MFCNKTKQKKHPTVQVKLESRKPCDWRRAGTGENILAINLRDSPLGFSGQFSPFFNTKRTHQRHPWPAPTNERHGSRKKVEGMNTRACPRPPPAAASERNRGNRVTGTKDQRMASKPPAFVCILGAKGLTRERSLILRTNLIYYGTIRWKAQVHQGRCDQATSGPSSQVA